MKIQVLVTPNCNGCVKVKKMLDSVGVKYEVIDVMKNPAILEKYPIMSAPGIVIDGQLVFTGVPREEDLKKRIAQIR